MKTMYKFIPSILALGLAAAYGCDPGEESGDIIANLEGEELRLADGWKDATACVVWQGTTECFRNDADAEQLIREIEKQDAPADLAVPLAEPEYACSRQCLHLYQNNGFDGRHLMFCDRGYWQNLGAYDFNDNLSSYKTGVHGVHLSYHANGKGNWYPGDTSACVESSQMKSGWNDEVSAIYIK